MGKYSGDTTGIQPMGDSGEIPRITDMNQILTIFRCVWKSFGLTPQLCQYEWNTDCVALKQYWAAKSARLVIADLYSTARSVEATASPVGGIQLRPSRAAGRCLPDGGLWLPWVLGAWSGRQGLSDGVTMGWWGCWLSISTCSARFWCETSNLCTVFVCIYCITY